MINPEACRNQVVAAAILAVLFGAGACGAQTPPQGHRGQGRSILVMYWPAVVRVSGQLVTAPAYGPPGFGEDTARDQQFTVPMLRLANPIDVRSNPASKEPDTTSRDSVAVVQLIFFPENPYAKHKDLVGHQVVVTGTLHPSSTASHYTPVILWVDKIEAPVGESRPS